MEPVLQSVESGALARSIASIVPGPALSHGRCCLMIARQALTRVPGIRASELFPVERVLLPVLNQEIVCSISGFRFLPKLSGPAIAANPIVRDARSTEPARTQARLIRPF